MAMAIFSGLVEFLETKPDVKGVTLTYGKPASVTEISSWERSQQCALPEDVKQFYQSNDGMKLEWSYQYNDTLMCLGRIHINTLSEIQPLHCMEGGSGLTSPDDTPSLLDLDRGNTLGGPWKPSFGGPCKIFALDFCPSCGHICLVCNTEAGGDEGCGVWLLDLSLSWHFLCPSLSDFLRLAVVHLGLFQWPYAFTPYGLSPQYEKWFHMFIPKRLELDVAQQQGDHTHGHTQAAIPPVLSNLDVSKVLYSKSLRDKRSKVNPAYANTKKPHPPMK